MNNEEIAQTLKELLTIARRTDYMWYYDDGGVHKGLIKLYFDVAGKELKCQCGYIINEVISQCCQCGEWVVYEDKLKEEEQ
jgi:hypothetical protein